MDGDGTLDPLEILYLYKAMLPTMTPIQVKLILIYMQVCACTRGTPTREKTNTVKYCSRVACHIKSDDVFHKLILTFSLHFALPYLERRWLSPFKLHDIVGVAEFQYRALLQMFRAVPVHMPHGCHPGTFNTLTSLEPSALSHRKQRGKSSVQSSTSKPGDGLQSTVFLLTIGDKGPMAIFSSLAAVLQVGTSVPICKASDLAMSHCYVSLLS